MHKNIKLLTYLNFFTDFKLYAPVAIIYFARVTNSYALGMAVFSVTMVSSAFLEIPTGIFSDLIGRKKTVILGALSAVLYSICFALGTSFVILAIGAFFEGLSRSFYSGNNDALLHDTLSQSNQQHKYAEFLGKTSAMFQFALALSALLGSALASFSFVVVMWLSVVPQVLCLIISFFLEEPIFKGKESGNIFSHFKQAFLQFISNKKLRLLSIASVSGYAFGEAGYQFQSAFYQMIWPIWAIGIAKTISNILAALSYHFSGKILQKIHGLKLLIIDNVYNRIINIFSLLVPTFLSPLFMSTTSVFYGVTSVTKNALMQQEFTNSQRATMGSLNSFFGSILFGVIAIVLGIAADHITPTKALLILQICQIANMWFYVKLFLHKTSQT